MKHFQSFLLLLVVVLLISLFLLNNPNKPPKITFVQQTSAKQSISLLKVRVYFNGCFDAMKWNGYTYTTILRCV